MATSKHIPSSRVLKVIDQLEDELAKERRAHKDTQTKLDEAIQSFKELAAKVRSITGRYWFPTEDK
jgi:hypothetical protein